MYHVAWKGNFQKTAVLSGRRWEHTDFAVFKFSSGSIQSYCLYLDPLTSDVSYPLHYELINHWLTEIVLLLKSWVVLVMYLLCCPEHLGVLRISGYGSLIVNGLR